MKRGFTYIMASKRNGTLYIGVTADLRARILAHRRSRRAAFTKRYSVTHLVWFEEHNDISEAIQRETSLKRWPRKWKLDLIESVNPEWADLFDQIAQRTL